MFYYLNHYSIFILWDFDTTNFSSIEIIGSIGLILMAFFAALTPGLIVLALIKFLFFGVNCYHMDKACSKDRTTIKS